MTTGIEPPQEVGNGNDLERRRGNREIPLRERALWRLLYDSAARAEEALGLDVPDLDLANRQARARVKGGHIHLLHFQTAAARLLRNLTAGREAGPAFLTERRAASHRVTAISGHLQLATLRQYVKPSQAAVAKLMADTDPDRRRR